MSEHRFDVAGIPRLVLRVPLGNIRIRHGESGQVVVRLEGSQSAVDRFRVERRGDAIHIEPEQTSGMRWSRLDVSVEIGEAADVHARITSADFAASTPLDRLVVETASGDIQVDEVIGDAQVRAASGDIRIREVGGSLEVASASGDIRVEKAASVSIKSASGDVTVDDIAGDVSVRSASGDVRLGKCGGSRIDVKSMAGDVAVGLLPGRRYEVALSSLSGDIRTEFPVQSDGDGGAAHLEIKTVAGDISVSAA